MDDKNIMDKHLFEVKDLQEYLGISRSMAYSLVRTKGFPVIRIGKKYKIPVENLKLWMDKKIKKGS